MVGDKGCCVFHPHSVFFRICWKKPVFCLPGSWIPLLFLNDEEYDWGIASNTGINELPGCWGLGGGGVESGSYSGLLNLFFTVKPY
jgi:hypothetical protein